MSGLPHRVQAASTAGWFPPALRARGRRGDRTFLPFREAVGLARVYRSAQGIWRPSRPATGRIERAPRWQSRWLWCV